MSGNINVLRKPRRVLIIASNSGVSAQTQWPIGFWWSELTHPYWELTEAGYEVEIRSPDGGTLSGDGYSDPEDESGYSAYDIVSLGFKHSKTHSAMLEDTKSIEGVTADDYDAIMLVGGQGPMYTFIEHEGLHALVAKFYEAGKPTVVICHATCVLLKVRLSNGDLLVKEKTWTGFADSEEKYADEFAGVKIQPFWIEEEARKIEGTNFVVDQRFRPFAVRDGNLITGQQQYSGTEAARLLIEALGR